jgi:hypothetical protein
MIQLFAKKSCSACIRIPSSFNLRVAKTARASRGIVALRCCRPPDEALASPEQICNIYSGGMIGCSQGSEARASRKQWRMPWASFKGKPQTI